MARQQQRDGKTKMLGLTNFIIELWQPKISIALLLVISVVLGAVGAVLLQRSLSASLLGGAVSGLYFLAAPALLSAVFATTLTKLSRKQLIFRRSAYLAFFATLLLSAGYLMGCIVGGRAFFDMLIFGFSLVFAVGTFVLTVTHPYGLARSAAIAFIHPFFGFLVIYYAQSFPVAPSMPIAVSILASKFALALVPLIIGTLLFAVMINAPMKRNFGKKTFELAGVFLANWLDKSSAIEDVFRGMASRVDTLVGVLAFRARGRLKALLIVPCLHPGPFGEIGGGKLTGIFRDILEKETGATVLVAHGTATHDMNPISADSLYEISEEILDSVEGMKFSPNATPSLRSTSGRAKVLGQRFGDSAFIASTFSPAPTEDIDFSIGLAVMNELKTDYGTVLFADSHNCHKQGDHAILSGNPAIFDLLEAAGKIGREMKRDRFSRFRLGIAVDPLSEWSADSGVGPTGLRAAVIEVAGQKTAYVIFDANNLVAGMREKAISAIKALGVDEVEVMTTDSHCVNNVQGVENPLGMKIAPGLLVSRAVETCRRALDDLEAAEAGVRQIKVHGVEVLGAQKSIELVSTINSMVAMMKIAAPLIFTMALIFSLLGTLFVAW